MSTGWIQLHRQLQSNPLWTCESFTRGQAWVDLLLMANHKDTFFYKRDIKISVKRGQVGRSEVELADRWKWSRSKVRKFLKDLEKEQQIEQQKTNVTQLLTIKNYDKYQGKEQQCIQQEDSKKTAVEHQQDTYNNNNKEKKEEKMDGPVKLKTPTIDEFIKYFQDNGYKTDVAEQAYFGYQENNWHDAKNNKITNWKNKVRNGWFKEQHKVKDPNEHLPF